MSKTSYFLTINKPCSQEWSSMTNTDLGKFCSHCSEQVIDFTQLTDKEVIQIIEKKSEKLCGRLNTEQLNRAIAFKKPSSFTGLHKIMASLFLLLNSKKNLATNIQKSTSEIVAVSDARNKNLQAEKIKYKSTADTFKNIFQGRIIDSITKEPVPYANIIIKGTPKGTPCDNEGRFNLTIPPYLNTSNINIEIVCVGYQKKEITITKNDLSINKDLMLVSNGIEELQALTGAVVVVRKKKRWWQRKKHW